jgi:hypothetical protein
MQRFTTDPGEWFRIEHGKPDTEWGL